MVKQKGTEFDFFLKTTIIFEEQRICLKNIVCVSLSEMENLRHTLKIFGIRYVKVTTIKQL
jgi:hypothetical protein